MITCEELFRIFQKNDLLFFTGVPDSTFKEWMKFLNDEHGKRLKHIIACNECEATAIAAGYNLASGKTGIVYMQNAGEGKTVNPLTSLCDSEVYSIPLILMIGWRGEPETKDEPQHKKMGRITLPLLEVLEVPYKILPSSKDKAEQVIREMKESAEKMKKPAAIIIKRNTFHSYEVKTKKINRYEMNREEAIKSIVDNFNGSEIIISTTGKMSRELFEHRIARNETPSDFYTLGSMGCAASIANGIALEKPDKDIFVFDGDGAAIMQLGSLATIGYYKPKNLYHIVFDNGSYDSTGGQPTVSKTINFEDVARACGYKKSKTIYRKSDLIKWISRLKNKTGPQLIVIKINIGSRVDLGRPTTKPIDNKINIMKKLSI